MNSDGKSFASLRQASKRSSSAKIQQQVKKGSLQLSNVNKKKR